MVRKAQASPTPCTRHADANVHATALPCTRQPGQARTSTGNEVGRHLRSLLRGLLVGPSTSWLSRSSNGLRTRTHPVRGAVMRERVQQAPQSARTSCRSTAQQLNAGFVADSEMSNQQLSRRWTAAPQQSMGRTTRPGSSPRSHRSASVGGPRGDSGRVRPRRIAHQEAWDVASGHGRVA